MKRLAALALIVLYAPALQAQTMPDPPLSEQVEITLEHDSEGEGAPPPGSGRCSTGTTPPAGPSPTGS